MQTLKLTKKYASYPEYKDSGVEWFGKIPKGWNLIPMRSVAQENTEKNLDGKCQNLLSLSYGKIVEKDITSNEGLLPESFNTYQIVKKGNIVFRLTDLQNDKRSLRVGFVDSNEPGIITSAYLALNTDAGLNEKFAYYLFHSYDLQKVYYGMGGGVRQTLDYADFKYLPLSLPEINEQEKIAMYLDEKTVLIDQIIKKKQKQIEFLHEKRIVVINRAVTKGLDPNVELVDSGVDWIGKIPREWEVKKLKHFFKVLDGRRIPLSADERTHRQGEYPYYGASGIIDYVDEYLFSEDLVLVGEDGANLLNRSTPIAFVARGKYWVNNHAHIIKPYDLAVFFWAERIEQVDMSLYTSGSAQPKLTIAALKNIVVSAPRNVGEKIAISDFVVKTNNRFNIAIQKAEHSIHLLQEFKSSLISHVVMGKVKV